MIKALTACTAQEGLVFFARRLLPSGVLLSDDKAECDTCAAGEGFDPDLDGMSLICVANMPPSAAALGAFPPV